MEVENDLGECLARSLDTFADADKGVGENVENVEEGAENENILVFADHDTGEHTGDYCNDGTLDSLDWNNKAPEHFLSSVANLNNKNISYKNKSQ